VLKIPPIVNTRHVSCKRKGRHSTMTMTRTTVKYNRQLDFDFRATFLPTLQANPSVFFIFPTALFLIQFLANPHWHIGFCPDTQCQKPKSQFCRPTGGSFGNKPYFCRAMKFLTFILATFILFLAVKPGMDLLSLQADTAQTCCSGQCTPNSDNDNSQDQNQDNDCGGNVCNPFQVCSSCVLVCLNIPFDYIPKPTTFSYKGFSYQSVFTSQFAPDFWQPPKIV